MTRFGEIWPVWQNFISLWQIVGDLLLIWLNVEPTLANLLHYWAHFYHYHKFKNNLAIWSHWSMATNLKIILPFGHTGKVHQLRCTLLYGYDWFIIWSTAVAIKLFKIIGTYFDLGRGCGWQSGSFQYWRSAVKICHWHNF